MSKKQVTISYTSHMYDTDEQINMTANGIMGNRDGVNIAMYNEQNEAMAPIRTILKFDENFLTVSKMGVTKTEMRYECGYTHKSKYHTFIGDYDMCIKTEEYDLKETDKGYKITTVYNLELDGNFISKCKVEIEISE